MHRSIVFRRQSSTAASASAAGAGALRVTVARDVVSHRFENLVSTDTRNLLFRQLATDTGRIPVASLVSKEGRTREVAAIIDIDSLAPGRRACVPRTLCTDDWPSPSGHGARKETALRLSFLPSVAAMAQQCRTFDGLPRHRSTGREEDDHVV